MTNRITMMDEDPSSGPASTDGEYPFSVGVMIRGRAEGYHEAWLIAKRVRDAMEGVARTDRRLWVDSSGMDFGEDGEDSEREPRDDA